MAKLEAVVSADITPFDKALSEASSKAQEFGKKLTSVGSGFVKSFSGIDISAALGIAGGVVGLGALTEATEKFASAALNAAREGYEAFEKFQRSVLQLKYALPSAMPEAARATEAREIAGMAGGKAGLFSGEEMRTAARIMMEASSKFAQSPDKLSHLLDAMKDVAFAQGGNITAVAESFKNLLVGAKEGREGGARAISSFFKENTALVPQAEEFRAEYEKAHPGRISESMKTMDIGQFMSTVSGQIGLPAMIAQIEAMLPKAAPGAAKEVEAEEPELQLKKTFAAIQKAFGDQLKPTIDEFIQTLIGFMPTLRDSFMGLAQVLKVAIPIMGYLVGAAQALLITFNMAVRAVAGFIDRISFGAFSGLKDALAAQQEANKTADQVNAKLESLGTSADGAGTKVADLGTAASDAANAQKELSAAAKEAIAIGLEAFKEHAKAEQEDVKAFHAHAAAMDRVALEAAQFDLRTAASTAAKRTMIERPIGATELEDKTLAAQAAADAKSINIRAEAAEKINAANEEAAEKINTIEEAAENRKIARQVEDKEIAAKQDEINNDIAATADEKKDLETALDDEKSARQDARNAEDAASAQAISDAKAEAAEKIREADIDAANQIIDAQEEAANETIEAQKAAALEQVSKMKPYVAQIEEAPAKWAEFGHWKGGVYHESEYERTEREKRNRENQAVADELNRQWAELQTVAIKREFDEKKRIVDDALEAQRPTQISLKHVHEIQQEEHVKAIEAEKRRTDADEDFAKQHEKLQLPSPPDKGRPGAADISRKILADILIKILDEQQAQGDDFQEVFMSG